MSDWPRGTRLLLGGAELQSLRASYEQEMQAAREHQAAGRTAEALEASTCAADLLRRIQAVEGGQA